ncbi:TetR/AcrR family transcriptional regulator [Aestuariibacter halophilus]|uniref:TetR/AcrR family transcriptional regulator n=1 Tax=Fluctibacter halophilus TaxID=226011 RepID=A0ABS8G4J3_9ALTE|nr:TetR/AcrR family transcriptional regulator [Aestuariibacter halophilus]MCC2615512.1 TetR/AcrR family transcriptional regulator [Aestuariibacter halophilus]
MANTKLQILNSAETLFAERGFNQTSMRDITTRANVNLASVNYHFGSKKNLIQAVMARNLDTVMDHIEQVLGHNTPSGVEAVLDLIGDSLQRLEAIRPGASHVLLVLLGQAYAETQGHLRRFIQQQYAKPLEALHRVLRQALPGLSPQALFWRLHFAMGAFVFSVRANQALREIAQADYQQQVDEQGIFAHLKPFVQAGLQGKAKQ